MMRMVIVIILLAAAGCAIPPPQDNIVRVGMDWKDAMTRIKQAGLKEVVLQTLSETETETFHDYAVPGEGTTRFRVSKEDRNINSISVMTTPGRKTNARWTSFQDIDVNKKGSQP